MEIALWILAIGPNLTVIHRIVHTWKHTKTSASELSSTVAHESQRDEVHETPVLSRSHSAGRGRAY
jgi:hypothetical protein